MSTGAASDDTGPHGDRALDVALEREVFGGEVYSSELEWISAGQPRQEEWPEKPEYPVVWEKHRGQAASAVPVAAYSSDVNTFNRFDAFLQTRFWGRRSVFVNGEWQATVEDLRTSNVVSNGLGATEQLAVVRAILAAAGEKMSRPFAHRGPTKETKITLSARPILTVAFNALAPNRTTDTDAPMVALVFSAAGLDASVNELLVMIQTGALGFYASEFDGIRAAHEFARGHVPTNEKLRLLIRGVGANPDMLGRAPFADALRVIEARHVVVHHSGDFTEYDTRSGRWKRKNTESLFNTLCAVVRRKDTKFAAPPSIVDLLKRREVGEWAFTNVCAAMIDLIRLMPNQAVTGAMESTYRFP
ncbi:MAG TPA: hypothetical protein VNV25_17290 [Gemmatimonadaceae bacterium]|jgi:hypothetical protein|nr:hypothetical protein [Gemmatimonadaceae bacterium]